LRRRNRILRPCLLPKIVSVPNYAQVNYCEAMPPVGKNIVTEGLGAFDEIDELGSGSFGTTFRVRRGDDEYAIKVIHSEGMPSYLWEREIGALSRVEHPNVVAFRDSGFFEVDDREYPFLTCEYIDGGSLKRNLDEGNRPPSGESLREMLTGLLVGVAEIQDLGIIHRDIKPANVGLREGDWGKPVLLDFGLAKVLDMSSHTVLGAHVGTTAYMAPEQLRGKPARRRSDLFAVAVTVYEAGTGRHPFLEPAVNTAQSLHDRIQQGAPQDPREQADIWPDDVAEVVLRLLSYAAHERLGITRALRDLEDD
jgi:eukaryotic-like serine/threonine-protein kinase